LVTPVAVPDPAQGNGFPQPSTTISAQLGSFVGIPEFASVVVTGSGRDDSERMSVRPATASALSDPSPRSPSAARPARAPRRQIAASWASSPIDSMTSPRVAAAGRSRPAPCTAGPCPRRDWSTRSTIAPISRWRRGLVLTVSSLPGFRIPAGSNVALTATHTASPRSPTRRAPGSCRHRPRGSGGDVPSGGDDRIDAAS